MEFSLMEKLPPFLRASVHNPAITDLCFRWDHAYADAGNGMMPISALEVQGSWNENELKHWCIKILSHLQKSWDAKTPYMDGLIPASRDWPVLTRIHILFPPLHPHGTLVSLRFFRETTHNPWVQDPAWNLLKNTVLDQKTLVLCGSTGSGKTTLLSRLIDQIPVQERVLAIEDTPEIQTRHPQFFSLVTRNANADGFGAIQASQLVSQTLRMRPDRVLIGECRGSEILDFLQIINTGHPGGLLSIHANSARDALKRIEWLSLISFGGKVDPLLFRERIASGVQKIAFLKRSATGRFVSEMQEIAGYESGVILTRSVYRAPETQESKLGLGAHGRSGAQEYPSAHH